MIVLVNEGATWAAGAEEGACGNCLNDVEDYEEKDEFYQW